MQLVICVLTAVSRCTCTLATYEPMKTKMEVEKRSEKHGYVVCSPCRFLPTAITPSVSPSIIYEY